MVIMHVMPVSDSIFMYIDHVIVHLPNLNINVNYNHIAFHLYDTLNTFNILHLMLPNLFPYCYHNINGLQHPI